MKNTTNFHPPPTSTLFKKVPFIHNHHLLISISDSFIHNHHCVQLCAVPTESTYKMTFKLRKYLGIRSPHHFVLAHAETRKKCGRFAVEEGPKFAPSWAKPVIEAVAPEWLGWVGSRVKGVCPKRMTILFLNSFLLILSQVLAAVDMHTMYIVYNYIE